MDKFIYGDMEVKIIITRRELFTILEMLEGVEDEYGLNKEDKELYKKLDEYTCLE